MVDEKSEPKKEETVRPDDPTGTVKSQKPLPPRPGGPKLPLPDPNIDDLEKL